MIDIEEALTMMLAKAEPLQSETISPEHCLGRVVHQHVIADSDMPAFNRSTMDGYAIRKSDLNKELDVIGILPAGKAYSQILEPGNALRIMTGATVPDGADMVVPVEQSTLSGTKVTFESVLKSNISLQGEDYRAGDAVIAKGTLIQPHHIGILAAVGYLQVQVYKNLRIGIVVSGDELVDASVKPGAAQIRNSNGPMLTACCRQLNLEVTNFSITNDTIDDAADVVSKALLNNDVLLISGGISTGDFDLVPKAIDRLNGNMIFRKVNIQPGKPFLFAIIGGKPVIGIPGNPVASLVTFHVLVKPFLLARMGHQFKPIKLNLICNNSIKPYGQRKSFVPAIINDSGIVESIKYNGSGHLHSFTSANALIEIEPNQKQVSKGEQVRVRLL